MKKLLIAIGLVVLMVGLLSASQWIVEDGLGGYIKELDHSQKIELVSQFAKEGIVCEVFGHSWCVYVDGKENSFYKHCDEDIDYGQYKERFCAICDKEQKHTPEKWEDFKEE